MRAVDTSRPRGVNRRLPAGRHCPIRCCARSYCIERRVVSSPKRPASNRVQLLGSRSAVQVSCSARARESASSRTCSPRSRYIGCRRAAAATPARREPAARSESPRCRARALDHLVENADRARRLAQRLVDLDQAALQLETLVDPTVARARPHGRATTERREIEAPDARVRRHGRDALLRPRERDARVTGRRVWWSDRLLEVVADDLVERAALVEPARRAVRGAERARTWRSAAYVASRIRAWSKRNASSDARSVSGRTRRRRTSASSAVADPGSLVRRQRVDRSARELAADDRRRARAPRARR